MIRLTDTQLKILWNSQRHYRPISAASSLQKVAERLEGAALGDGAVHQAGVVAQKEVLFASDRETLRYGKRLRTRLRIDLGPVPRFRGRLGKICRVFAEATTAFSRQIARQTVL